MPTNSCFEFRIILPYTNIGPCQLSRNCIKHLKWPSFWAKFPRIKLTMKSVIYLSWSLDILKSSRQSYSYIIYAPKSVDILPGLLMMNLECLKSCGSFIFISDHSLADLTREKGFELLVKWLFGHADHGWVTSYSILIYFQAQVCQVP